MSYFCFSTKKHWYRSFHAILNIVYKGIFTDSNVFSFSLHLSACICRYTYLRCIIEKQLSCLPEGATCMWAAHQTVKSLPQRTTRDKDSDQGSADKNPTYVFKQPSSSSGFQPLHGLFSKPSNQSTKLKTVHVRCDCVGLRIHDGSCRLVRSNHFISLCLYLFHHTWYTQKASLLLPSRMSLKWDVLCSVFSPVYNLIPQIKVKHKHQKIKSACWKVPLSTKTHTVGTFRCCELERLCQATMDHTGSVDGKPTRTRRNSCDLKMWHHAVCAFMFLAVWEFAECCNEGISSTLSISSHCSQRGWSKAV